MEKLLQQILEGQAHIIKRLDNIENTIVTKEMFNKFMTEGQKDVIAMLERASTKESTTEAKANIEVLNTRLFQQESKIAALTIAK